MTIAVAGAQSTGGIGFLPVTIVVFSVALLVLGSFAGALASPAMKLVAVTRSRMMAASIYSLVLSLLFVAVYWGISSALSGTVDASSTGWAFAATAGAVLVAGAGMSAVTVFRRRSR